ncbi:MAG: diguanylate cyclase [Dehalococcoidia bacterium]|nr:diguanylate cyclase [Dehalococcoidia bacterium]
MSRPARSLPAQRAVLRVLLVEPSVDDTRAVRDLLNESGDYRVHAARDLDEARTLLDEGHFDAALVESGLWHEDGAGLVRFIRERRPDVAIVVMTSAEDERETLPALKLGAHDFVTKRNLDTAQLTTRIVLAVEESRALRRRDTMVRWLEREARTDHLTGLYNRRAFDERLRDACAMARTRDEEVALVVVDVVGTRVVNEAHGHEAGDAMIRRAAHGISRCLRAGDFAARIGGDDFGIIIINGGIELGRRIARRIAHEVERLNDEDWSDSIPVSLVFGVASGRAPDATDLFAAAEDGVTAHGPARPAVAYFPFWEDSDGPSVA